MDPKIFLKYKPKILFLCFGKISKPKIFPNQSKRERAMGASNHDNDFNSTTNWKLVDGTLIDAISFESSFTANPESDDGIISAAVDHVTKSPLLLLPPVPNGEPCEITSTVLNLSSFFSEILKNTLRSGVIKPLIVSLK